MITRLRTLRDRGERERGETPMLVMIGLVVFAIVSLAAGPALANLAAQSSQVSNDRRVDKALSLLVEQARRQPWQTFFEDGDTVKAPYVEEVDLANRKNVRVSTWIEKDGPGRIVVTKAIQGHLSAATCDAVDEATGSPLIASPADLPDEGCIVRVVSIAATANDVRPPMSPLVNVIKPGVDTSTPTLIQAATPQDPAKIFEVLFPPRLAAPMQVAVVAKMPGVASQYTLEIASHDNIVRGNIVMKPSTNPASGWTFGNAVICPQWSRAGEGQAGQTGRTYVRLKTGAAPVQLSELIVVSSASVPASYCE